MISYLNFKHPPSPGTNKTFLFKREPPDGAEVVRPKCQDQPELGLPNFGDPWSHEFRKQHPLVVKPIPAKNSFFEPSANSNFVRYKSKVKL